MLLYKDIHYDARVKREALALAEAGYRVDIACVKEYQEPPPFLHENINIIRLSISVKKIKTTISQGDANLQTGSQLKKMLVWIVRTPIIKIVKDYLAYYEFYKKVKIHFKGKKDIKAIHCHDLNTLWQGKMLAENFSAKLIYDSHEIFNEMAGRNRLDRIIGYRMEKSLFRNIDYLITVNEYLRDFLFDKNGEKPSVLIQNIPIFHQETPKTKDPNFWGYNFETEDIILIYQGGFSPYRGLDLIIKVMSSLPEKYKLVLIGSGILKDELKNLVSELNLEQRVFFHEQVPSEELINYTIQADIGLVMYEKVSKNNYYSTPNKIFEYIQAGIPAVSSNHPGKSVIINKYKTGVLVEETIEDITIGIFEVIHNYEMYQNNCFYAQKELTWKTESLKLKQLYNEVFNEN